MTNTVSDEDLGHSLIYDEYLHFHVCVKINILDVRKLQSAFTSSSHFLMCAAGLRVLFVSPIEEKKDCVVRRSVAAL